MILPKGEELAEAVENISRQLAEEPCDDLYEKMGVIGLLVEKYVKLNSAKAPNNNNSQLSTTAVIGQTLYEIGGNMALICAECDYKVDLISEYPCLLLHKDITYEYLCKVVLPSGKCEFYKPPTTSNSEYKQLCGTCSYKKDCKDYVRVCSDYKKG